MAAEQQGLQYTALAPATAAGNWQDMHLDSVYLYNNDQFQKSLWNRQWSYRLQAERHLQLKEESFINALLNATNSMNAEYIKIIILTEP